MEEPASPSGEPYQQARALRQAADVAARHDQPLADLVEPAARIFRELGADRSLAELLRAHGERQALRDFVVPASQARRAHAGLTPRETEVAELAGRGLTAVAIADRLGISPSTARRHLEQVKQKLGVSRKSQLVELLSGR